MKDRWSGEKQEAFTCAFSRYRTSGSWMGLFRMPDSPGSPFFCCEIHAIPLRQVKDSFTTFSSTYRGGRNLAGHRPIHLLRLLCFGSEKASSTSPGSLSQPVWTWTSTTASSAWVRFEDLYNPEEFTTEFLILKEFCIKPLNVIDLKPSPSTISSSSFLYVKKRTIFT